MIAVIQSSHLAIGFWEFCAVHLYLSLGLQFEGCDFGAFLHFVTRSGYSGGYSRAKLQPRGSGMMAPPSPTPQPLFHHTRAVGPVPRGSLGTPQEYLRSLNLNMTI